MIVKRCRRKSEIMWWLLSSYYCPVANWYLLQEETLQFATLKHVSPSFVSPSPATVSASSQTERPQHPINGLGSLPCAATYHAHVGKDLLQNVVTLSPTLSRRAFDMYFNSRSFLLFMYLIAAAPFRVKSNCTGLFRCECLAKCENSSFTQYLQCPPASGFKLGTVK